MAARNLLVLEEEETARFAPSVHRFRRQIEGLASSRSGLEDDAKDFGRVREVQHGCQRLRKEPLRLTLPLVTG